MAYVVFGSVEGFGPLFENVGRYHFGGLPQLGWFAFIGVVGGLMGLRYSKGFYGIAGLFARSPLPRWLRPAVGGLLVGATGIVIPEVLATGYGWVQKSLGHQLLSIPLWIVLLLPVARIVATGLSLGSGGSGGIFGPGMVIGAFIGAAVWRLFEPLVPSMGHDPARYVIVGMMCCFGGISRAPLAEMLMVAEMTGSVSILGPAMIAVGPSWLIVRRTDETIYRAQPVSRADAPAQRILTGLPLLSAIPTAHAMAVPRLVVDGDLTAGAARRALADARVTVAPVVDRDGRFEGTVSVPDLSSGEAGRRLGTLVDAGAPTIAPSSTLDQALEALTSAPGSWIPVLDPDRRVIGTLAVSDLVRAYRWGLLSNLPRLTAAGTSDVDVEGTSPLAGQCIREIGLPAGVLITSVQRNGNVLTATGDRVLEPGDRLSVLGRSADVDRLRALAGPAAGSVVRPGR